MEIRFIYADKTTKEVWLPALFEILHANMSVIAPTGCSYEEDYAEWHANLSPALEKAPRQIVLIYDGDELIGYFQYYVNGTASLFMMEEIQLRQGYHGTGVFGRLYAWLIPLLPRDVRWVEAYAHISNKKSQGVLTHLGLSPVGDVSGTIRHFRGELAPLAEKYAPQNETGIDS